MPETSDWYPTRYLASLYSPASERAVLDTLFGVESEIVASLRGGLDHTVAHVRLQWWREECDRLAQGKPAHPLTRTLAAAFGERTAVLAGVSGFVESALWDLAAATFETRHELSAYCERWAAAMIVPAALHAAPDMQDTRIWLEVGSAMHELEMLAHVASEARSGRLRLPLDEIERAGAQASLLGVPPWPAALVTVMHRRHAALRARLSEAVRSIDRSAQPALRGLLAWSTLAWRGSKRAQAALPDARLPGRFDAPRDGWFAWRAARRAMVGKFSLT